MSMMSENIDYIALLEKKKKKAKNLKVKKKYLILQKRNQRLQEFLRDDEIETSLTRKRKATKINKKLFMNALKLKRQRSIYEMKSINLDIYNDKKFKNLKTEHVMLLMSLKQIYSIFFRNKLK